MNLQHHLVATPEAEVADGIDCICEVILHKIGDGRSVVDVVTLREVLQNWKADS